MNKHNFILLCIALCCSLPLLDALSCPDADAQCNAVASLRIAVTSGSCSGSASANCDAFASSTGGCVDIVKRNIDEDKCTEQTIREAAQCVAKAVAAVYAQAYAAVTCSGSGFGCGYSHANGNSWACAFAIAVVDLSVSVGANQAQCEAQIAALAGVFATAATEVQASVCTSGGSVSDFEEELAVRVEQVCVNAFATCFVTCDGSSAIAEVDGGASVVQSSPFSISTGDSLVDGGRFDLPIDVLGGRKVSSSCPLHCC